MDGWMGGWMAKMRSVLVMTPICSLPIHLRLCLPACLPACPPACLSHRSGSIERPTLTNQVDRKGRTACFLAAAHAHPAVLRALLLCGSDSTLRAKVRGRGIEVRGMGRVVGSGVRGQHAEVTVWTVDGGRALARGLRRGLRWQLAQKGYPDPPLHPYQDGTAPIEAARDDECRLLLGGAAAWLNRAVLATLLYG